MEEAWVVIVGFFYLGLFSLAFYDARNRVEHGEKYLVKIKIREELSKEISKPKPRSKPKSESKPRTKPKPEPKPEPLTEQSIKDDVVACLRRMGSTKKEAVEAVDSLADTTKYVDAGELLKDIFKKH
jgi:hypothetical protein